MRKKKKEIICYHPTIHYENESVDVVKFCYEYLSENNLQPEYFLKNLNLLENILFIYTLIKIISWKNILKQDFNEINDINSLQDLFQLIKSIISDDEKQNEFFIQYVHCITYLIGKSNNQDQIPIVNNESNQIEIYYEDNVITQISIGKQIPSYQVPCVLLKKLNDIFQKGPVLKK